MGNPAEHLWSARDTLVRVWERHSHREGTAYSADALEEIEAACDDVDFDALDDENADLLQWVKETTSELADGERALDDCRLVIDVIEFRLYHVLRDADLPDETHPTVAEVLADEV
jgi:hypothetical protein